MGPRRRLSRALIVYRDGDRRGRRRTGKGLVGVRGAIAGAGRGTEAERGIGDGEEARGGPAARLSRRFSSIPLKLSLGAL